MQRQRRRFHNPRFLLKAHKDSCPTSPWSSPSAVRECEIWLTKHFRESGAVMRAVRHSGLAERTLKRRFKAVTGLALIDYLQDLRIEEGKRLLVSSKRSAEEISTDVGYEDA